MVDGYSRRNFLRLSALIGLTNSSLPSVAATLQSVGQGRIRISLAEWSLHRAIRSRLITNLDFPRIAREQFGIEGLEFVNQLWEAPTQSYLNRLKRAIEQSQTRALLIMVDGEGQLGHYDRQVRQKSVRNHYKWVEIAAELGCHSIRTNMRPAPGKNPKTPQEIQEFLNYCTEAFHELTEYASKYNINVIIENHGGISSNPDVLVELMKRVNRPNFGTLPDFGNFPKEIDKYEAVKKLMPYAKAVSFKCYDFGPDGNETTIDMDRMMRIVLESGYRGWVGIEYEGRRLTEFEGIQAAKRFLERYT